MDAQHIVDKIGAGILNALRTNEKFLGHDEFQFKNADIRPEYVTTVKVAEEFAKKYSAEDLSKKDVIVTLEAPMKELKNQALTFSRINSCSTKDSRSQASQKIQRYNIGKKDGNLLDILVKPSEKYLPPYLMAEIKLGTRNLSGVCNDIGRIFDLLSMYNDSGYLKNYPVYGAIAFHMMKEGVGGIGLDTKSSKFLQNIDNHCSNLESKHHWLKYKSGALNNWQEIKSRSIYEDPHEDETIHNVVAKDQFAFKPGLVLLGNACDIKNVKF